jgi:hypothetical protein
VLASSTGTDATLPLVTSTEAGLAPLSGGGTSNFLRADGTWAAPGGGSPGGSDTHVQFNDGSAFGGDAGLTYNKTTDVLSVTGGLTLGSDLFLARDAAATLRLGAADAASPVSQTLCVQDVVAGTTNTTGAVFNLRGCLGTGNAAPAAINIQLGDYTTGSGTAQKSAFNAVVIDSPTATVNRTRITLPGYSVLFTASGGLQFAPDGNSRAIIEGAGHFTTGNGGSFRFSDNGTGLISTRHGAGFYADALDVVGQRSGTNAQTYRLYNTYTDSSNYERVTLNWASNVCYLQPQNAGTGSARIFVPVTGSTTVSGLPAASSSLTGARAFVTDANSTTFLSTVAGGGANKVPVVCDGTNWLIG